MVIDKKRCMEGIRKGGRIVDKRERKGKKKKRDGRPEEKKQGLEVRGREIREGMGGLE